MLQKESFNLTQRSVAFEACRKASDSQSLVNTLIDTYDLLDPNPFNRILRHYKTTHVMTFSLNEGFQDCGVDLAQTKGALVKQAEALLRKLFTKYSTTISSYLPTCHSISHSFNEKAIDQHLEKISQILDFASKLPDECRALIGECPWEEELTKIRNALTIHQVYLLCAKLECELRALEILKKSNTTFESLEQDAQSDMLSLFTPFKEKYKFLQRTLSHFGCHRF